MGLPQVNRLKRRQDFQAVYQQGDRYPSSHLILLTRSASVGANANLPTPTRIGISISLKVSKKAVIRNRLKRQIRAAIRELLPDVSPNRKIVVVVRPKAVECKYEHFLRELKQLFIKAEIINGNSRNDIL